MRAKSNYEASAMKFADYICFEASLPQLDVTERDEAISALAQSLDKAGRLGPGLCQELTKAVIGRENEASTGIGKGVAVPHVKHPAVKEVIGVVGQCTHGLDFSALDKQLVFSVVLILSPADNPDRHLQAMEGVFKHLQYEKFRKFLRQSNTVELIEDLFHEADENPSWA
jgi:PTS system nitrogen regulatory IIA component